MKRHITWVVLLTIAILAGCTAPPDRHEKAQKMVERLYTALQHQEWDKALDMYGKEFYKGTSREAWLAHLKSIQQRLGKMQGYTQSFMQRQSKYYSSDVYIFGYSVRFAKGETEESITLYQPPGDKAMYIAGHRIVEHPAGQ